MLLPFLKWIQSGTTAELAEAVEANPSLCEWRDAQGISALMWSVYYGQTAVRDFLLARLAARGVALDIFEAAAAGNTTRLEETLGSDAQAVHRFSPDGWTALHLAAAFGTPEAAAVLLRNGARVDAISQNPQRNQPLHAALALGGGAKMAEILLQYRADPNAVQVGGYTPLFSAAAANRKDLAELLIAHGADPHPVNDSGKTPAEYARERGHIEVANWLDSLPANARTPAHANHPLR
ncbi:MAG TPA: ankyrin repeat domain-containing protein [Terracidiphilus sp.]|nr:ankyrin repeat domain-containing protein [Terracidiphilus sp.]